MILISTVDDLSHRYVAIRRIPVFRYFLNQYTLWVKMNSFKLVLNWNLCDMFY